MLLRPQWAIPHKRETLGHLGSRPTEQNMHYGYPKSLRLGENLWTYDLLGQLEHRVRGDETCVMSHPSLTYRLRDQPIQTQVYQSASLVNERAIFG